MTQLYLLARHILARTSRPEQVRLGAPRVAREKRPVRKWPIPSETLDCVSMLMEEFAVFIFGKKGC